ncbi:ABC transporter ATP-binding protein [Metabacillus sp. 84]|uniref:ABC transporter ATP-binding protein n=1 Tax=unclassified Metabacillus TaxID=2675274 RepID=UPI003CEAA40C
MNHKPLLRLEDVGKCYKSKESSLRILQNIHLTVRAGELNVIMGPSGSGKSTLLNLMGLLDDPTEGTIHLDSQPAAQLTEKEKSRLRSKTIGFVFQDFNLFPNLSALENVTMPLLIHKDISVQARDKKAKELLELVGLTHRMEHMPSSLSGGEKQRVSIARALAANPKMLLADEPTGNVDDENEEKIIELFKKLSSSGVALIVVTHNSIYKQHADRFYTMQKGTLLEGEQKYEAK